MDTSLGAINTINLYNGRHYSSARNLQEWWCNSNPELFGLDVENAKAYNMTMAHAAWFLSDYQFAVETYKALIQRFPDLDSETIRQLIAKFETEYSVHEQRVFCENDMLRAILERLRYVFDGIDKPIRVYVAQNEETYKAFHRKTFPGQEIYPFSALVACGFYWDPSCYWLVFKAEYLDGSKSVDALTGLCAHEMAHLDLNAKGIHNGFLRRKTDGGTDFFIQERMTDLYVLSKGLMHALYMTRKEFGASKWVISCNEIVELAKDLQGVKGADRR